MAEGETVAIYRKNMYRTAFTVALFSVISISVISLADRRGAVIAGVVIAVLIGIPIVLEFRKAIVISPEAFEYRWGTGNIAKIKVADIQRINEVSTTYKLGMRPVTAPGLQLILNSGEVRTFPVDFPGRAEIVERLRRLVSV